MTQLWLKEEPGSVLHFTYPACTYEGKHVAGPKCTQLNGTIDVTTCYYGDYQGNTDNSWLDPASPDNGGGAVTGGSGPPEVPEDPTPPIITLPVLPKIPPCDELKRNEQDALFKARMTSLHSNIPGTSEKGFNIYDFTQSFIPGGLDPTCGPIITSINSQAIAYGPITAFNKSIAHNHLEASTYNHTGVFNPNDIKGLADLATASLLPTSKINLHQLTAYLVCKEGNYVIKVADDSKLYNFAYSYTYNPIF